MFISGWWKGHSTPLDVHPHPEARLPSTPDTAVPPAAAPAFIGPGEWGRTGSPWRLRATQRSFKILSQTSDRRWRRAALASEQLRQPGAAVVADTPMAER